MNDSFILYTSYYAIIEGLSDEQLGQLTRAIFIYARDGKIIELEPVVRMAFSFIRDNIDRNADKYQKKCEKMRENIKKRWEKKQADNEGNIQKNTNVESDTDVYKSIQKNTDVYKSSLYDNDNDNKNEYDNVNENDNEGDNDATNVAINNKPSKEGIQSASVKPEAPSGGKGSKSQRINYASVKEYWNRKHDETRSAMPPITLMTENRKVMVKARFRQCNGNMNTLFKAIDIAMASDFMNGNNKHGWLGKFDWIFGNEQNFAKVLEGNFNNEPASNQSCNGNVAAAPSSDGRESIGERWKKESLQAPVTENKDAKFLCVINQVLADLKKNPNNIPARQSMMRYYEKGILQRLGIDWKPEK